MSNVANYHSVEQVQVNQAARSVSDITPEQTAVMYMTFWMTAGTIGGAYLGWLQFAQAPGDFLPAVVMISAVTGSVVGASIGQLIAGLFHIIANNALD
jgi:hypothetical protein